MNKTQSYKQLKIPDQEDFSEKKFTRVNTASTNNLTQTSYLYYNINGSQTNLKTRLQTPSYIQQQEASESQNFSIDDTPKMSFEKTKQLRPQTSISKNKNYYVQQYMISPKIKKLQSGNKIFIGNFTSDSLNTKSNNQNYPTTYISINNETNKTQLQQTTENISKQNKIEKSRSNSITLVDNQFQEKSNKNKYQISIQKQIIYEKDSNQKKQFPEKNNLIQTVFQQSEQKISQQSSQIQQYSSQQTIQKNQKTSFQQQNQSSLQQSHFKASQSSQFRTQTDLGSISSTQPLMESLIKRRKLLKENAKKLHEEQVKQSQQSGKNYGRRKSFKISVENFPLAKKGINDYDKKGIEYGHNVLSYFLQEKQRLEHMKYDDNIIYSRLKEQLDIQGKVIVKMITLIENLSDNYKNYQILEELLQEIHDLSQKTQNQKLQMFLQLQIAKILQEVRKVRISTVKFKHLKEKCENNNDYLMKMKCYHGICKSLIALKKYDQARLFICKLLQLAWHCKKDKHELKAYNLMGLCYYYIGDIFMAKYYEERAILNHLEHKSSGLKKICMQFLFHKMKKKQDKKNEKISNLIFKKSHQDDSMNLFSSDDDDDKNLLGIMPDPHDKVDEKLRLNARDLFKECQKVSYLTIALREQLPFNPHTDRNFMQTINDMANQNIRQPKYVDAVTFIKNRPPIKVDPDRAKMQGKNGKLYYSHMSNYRSVDSKILRKENSEKLLDQLIYLGQQKEHWESPNYKKVSNILSKMSQALRVFMGLKDQYFISLFAQGMAQQKDQKHR